MTGEHFIPFRKSDVVAMCAAGLPAGEAEQFEELAQLVSALLRQKFYARIETLKDAYHPFDPGSDTKILARLTESEKAEARSRLEHELASLARAANFIEISADELDRAFTDHSLLRVRLEANREVVDKVMFFRRGETTRSEQIRTFFGLRRKTINFKSFSRVLVYVTFKNFAESSRLPFRPGSTIIKLFQNVPRDDLEMVLPNVQVRMRRIDKLLIGIPALISGVFVIVTKFITAVWLLMVLIAVWLRLSDRPVPMTTTTLLTTGVGLAAFCGYVLRQVSNFKNRKILFMKALSENLYFRNLGNDSGVFYNLLAAAEEAEAIEALLAYHFLHIAGKPLTPSELDHVVETWFAKRWDERIDFDVNDGIRKLTEWSIKDVPLPEAISRVRQLLACELKISRSTDFDLEPTKEAVTSPFLNTSTVGSESTP